MKLGQLMDMVKDNVFRKYFACFEWQGPKFMNQAQLSKTEYYEFVVFYSFEGMRWDNKK